ncbi:MAG TPA: glycine zipper domain-containing protein [Gemmatimonadaceae bacterium]|nr:glycine zipper domain-containing protein [Gemmatimonadaceae bacterium]
MRLLKTMILAPALMVAVACGRDSGQSVDSALDNDLRLAGEAYTPSFDSISALEQMNSETQLTATQQQRTAAAPVRRTTAPRATTARRTSSGSGTVARAPQPVVVTKKNTGRDAAIGATAGAVLGATTSRNKVKGGLIGAAIGGIAGAVIGNNVDVQRDTVWR